MTLVIFFQSVNGTLENVVQAFIENRPEARLKGIKLPNRKMPVQFKDDSKEKLDAFMTKKLITPCYSPYSAPAMLVPKKNGELRLVINYRKLNEQSSLADRYRQLKNFLIHFKEVPILRQ